MAKQTKLTEQQKVQGLYSLIGERGLYVNSNLDVFSEDPERVPIGATGNYSVPLIKPGAKAYASPLLFAAITSLLNHGTMIVTGAPGIGKTTGCEYAGHFFTNTPLERILEAEIQGNPQLKTEDLIASLDTVQMVHSGKKIVIPTKFLQCPVKIMDEVNRTPPELLSVAMKLVDTGKAVYQGVSLESPKGPLFATANYSDEGTFQLTPPFLDRFDVAVMVTSPNSYDLSRIRNRGDEKLNGGIESLLTIPKELALDFDRIRKEINSMPEEKTDEGLDEMSLFADFVYASLRFSEAASTNLARATKGNAWQSKDAGAGHFNDMPFMYTSNELSVRTVKAMQRYAKASAWLNGKEKAGISDLKTVLPYLLWHKVIPSEKALTTDTHFANDRIALIEHLVNSPQSPIQMAYDELKTRNEELKYTAS